jgi:cell division protein ZipA
MDNLRWALLAAGVAVVVGIYLWEMRRRRRREEDALDEEEQELLSGLSASRDDDPFAELVGVRGDRLKLDADDVAQLGAMVPEGAEPEPEPERPAPRREPSQPAGRTRGLYSVEQAPAGRGGEELIIMLNVMAEPGETFPGPAVRDALESVDMRHGDMKIFHHHGVGDVRSEKPVFSVASIVEPGVFDLDRIEDFTTPGLVMFMRLPGPLDPRVAFELMLNTGQRIAEALGGELRDETRSVLSGPGIAHIRERITEFNRRRLIAAS